MKSDFLAKSPLLALPLGALFLFLIIFLTVVVITMRRRAPAYDPIARLPLDEEDDDHKNANPETKS
jgi:hypothetical protein